MKRYRVTMGRSLYGHPEPRIEVRLGRGSNFRKLSAELHLLAAAVELATPDAEGWIARTRAASADDTGWVYLELLNATDDEAQRGLAVLQSVSRAQGAGVLE